MITADSKPSGKRTTRANSTTVVKATPTAKAAMPAKAMSPAKARAILRDWARGIARTLPHEPNSTQHPLCTLSSQQTAQLRAVLARRTSHDDPANIIPLWLLPP